MTQSELLEILERHRKWLAKESDGRPADLHGADLHGADLLGADLSEANLNGADLRYTNLRGADLRYTDLRGADLRGADLYKCCLPLWCGGTSIKLDRMQMAQLIYQFCSMECDDSEMLTLQKSLYVFANEFAEWYGNIKKFPETAAQ